MSSLNLSDLMPIMPLLTIVITAMVVLMVDLALPRDRKSLNVAVSLVGIVIAFGFCVYGLWGKGGPTAFNGMVIGDDFAVLFQVILLVVAVLSILLSERYIQTKGINYGEYYALLLFSTSGAMLMAASRELITIFIGLEVLSIALYVLSGFARTEARSEEAAMKYFLLGSFSSGFFLYGIALIYGGTGTTRLDMLSPHAMTALGAPMIDLSQLTSPYTVAGIALLIVGLGFKAAIVPFHSWTPDVYEGAPTSVTAFMSAGAKAGAFAAFVRVAITLLPLAHVKGLEGLYSGFESVLWALAVLTMIVGNVVAVMQTNIKRMLAYSSIAHAGYILVGLLAQNTAGHAGILFYMLAYTFMNLGAFGVLILLARRGEELVTIQDLQGLAARHPVAAGTMAVFMLSLGGIPPTAGFMGKLYLFLGAVQAGQTTLAVIGLLASVIGVFYYLRIIVSMFFEPPRREFPARVWGFAPFADVALLVSVLFTLWLGIYPSGVYNVAQQGAVSLDAPSGFVPPGAGPPEPAPRISAAPRRLVPPVRRAGLFLTPKIREL